MANLHTVSQQHSVKEAVISFILTPKLSNFSAYEELVEKGMPLHDRYQKFEPIFVKEIKVEANLQETKVDGINDRGFKILRFEDERVSDIIQAIPQPNQTLLTFNTVNYKGWSEFLPNSMESAKIIANVYSGSKLEGIGVMFIDEFFFEEQSKYNPKEIFNLDSPNLPQSIFDSDRTDYNLSNHKISEGFDYMENISMQLFDEDERGRKIIRITGNIMSYIQPLSFKEVINSSDLRQYLDFAHDKNKEMLRSILSTDALKMIGL